MLFSNLIDLWLKNKQQTLKERTLSRYNEIIESHIKPTTIYKMNIKDISLTCLQKFQHDKLLHGNMKTKGALSPNTVKNIMSVIKNTLCYASDIGLRVRDISRLHTKATPMDRDKVFRLEEQKKIERVVLKSKKTNHFGIVLCLYTGLRLGELLALEWEDIDFHLGILTVSKNCSYSADNYGKYHIVLDSPKTEASARIIPIPMPLLMKLKEIRRKNKNKSKLIICTKHGEYVSSRSYQGTYKKILVRAGVEYKNFHVLRHTFATRALESRMDIKTLSEIMGHKSPAVTMNRYAHSLMETKQRAMNQLIKSLRFGL